jgi:solute carrier family 39 (zinc transporter), member 1/2/3
MSIHAFFECLAVGLQKTPIGVLSLASAILVHKWAEGLTLGLIYRKEGFSDKISTLMVVFQGCINVLGLLAGASLIGQGYFVMACFMSVSAGTFLYISLGEVLLEQVQSMTKRKIFTMLLANVFLSALVWF